MKRIVSLLMVVCLVMAICAPTTTAKTDSNSSVTVLNCSDKISARQIAEIKESVGAYLTLNDGSEVSIPSVVKIEDVQTDGVSAYSLSPENSYMVSLEVDLPEFKSVGDSGSQNFSGIQVSATLSMVWKDGPGLENVIYSVEGTKKVVKGKESWSKVRWGNGWQSTILWTEKNVTGQGYFYYLPGDVVPCPKAEYSILMDGAPWTLVLTVSSSVLQ